MSTTAPQTRRAQAALLALVAFALCFVLGVYTLLHEAGHAIVGMLFGQTLMTLNVNFLTLSAHVGLVGELTQAQRSLQSIAGVGLPLMIWLIFISCVPRRASLLVELLKGIASVTVVCTLLPWIVLPLFYHFGRAPVDDVSNFLDASGLGPFLLSLGALIVFIAGWGWFLHKIQGVRSEIALFSPKNRDEVFAGLRRPLAVTAGLLVAASVLIIVLSNTLNPLAPSQGFEAIAQLDLSARAYSSESLTQFSLAQPTKIEVYVSVQHIDTTYFDLRITGSNGFNAVILHGEDYSTDQDRVSWSRKLAPGNYQLVVTSHQTPGTISIFMKDHYSEKPD